MSFRDVLAAMAGRTPSTGWQWPVRRAIDHARAEPHPDAPSRQ